jgi:hypothetical protein
MARQVPIVAILMIVQGALECMMGALLGLAAFLFPSMFDWINQMAQRQPVAAGQPIPQMPPEMIRLITIIYIALGIAAFIAGVFRISAGCYNIRYRARGMGIAALFIGILTFPTCYCAPTSLGLMIYGLIVYFSGETGRAFALVAEGKSPEAVKAMLERERHMGRHSDYDPNY